MKLYFTCPTLHKQYSSPKYTLLAGHRVVEEGHNQKKLQGRVTVDSPCPHCGKFHSFSVDEIVCPLSRKENG